VTDRRTDGQTDRRPAYINNVRSMTDARNMPCFVPSSTVLPMCDSAYVSWTVTALILGHGFINHDLRTRNTMTYVFADVELWISLYTKYGK